ncbi:PIN domain-like protein [Daedalea quercina L-15889]|uniref:PIN domain-like protein n=1 Tax=Daedalea quercina L-15889 TaxID=1314783 RepID=A0A165T716_9APHY|nr:PIN domain-like protein [Daedalea quercina L-15889]
MGVKSLWQLLDPVGRPVLLETMEGKAMAIDSSIWIYQFQATMRDKEGRGLVNAHVLGFLRRICKLLFYGIKPVFVFDGGAPALKRATISERKKKKSGAALSHARVAERLLAAHMRREALNQVKSKSGDSSKRKSKVPDGPVVIDENAVYMEDLDDSIPTTPAKKADATSPPSSKKKSRWHDHDPYKLPAVNMEEAIAKATRSTAPDPRLATEEELAAFIEEMRPEDFDVTSPAFRELPTEVQYEIVGDMRLKSRQTSYKRLQNMLRNAKTPLDFSKEQIKNLKHRNALTQQLLVTTDSIGKAHVEIPIRIASERNKQYILVKNEGAEGGWVLGIRDEGSRSKPIEIDPVSDKENEGDDSDVDMEEVAITNPAAVDPDLREYRRSQALSALADRYSPKKLAPVTTRTHRRPKNTRPLFAPEEDGLPVLSAPEEDETADPELMTAVQESLEAEEEANLRRAMEASRTEAQASSRIGENGASSSKVTLDGEQPRANRLPAYYDDDDDDNLYASPSRLETALSIAGAGPPRRPASEARMASGTSGPRSSIFGTPTLLLSESSRATSAPSAATALVVPSDSESEGEMEEVPVPPQAPTTPPRPLRVDQPAMVETITAPSQQVIDDTEVLLEDSDEDMEEVSFLPQVPGVSEPQIIRTRHEPSPSPIPTTEDIPSDVPPEAGASADIHEFIDAEHSGTTYIPSPVPIHESSHVAVLQGGDSADASELHHSFDSEDDETVPWDRSPSPSDDPSGGNPRAVASTADGWDAADEMDPHAEEGEFARFISQVKGKDIESVRREIDDEIRELHQQRKAAMRDSEDVTQQMISQIMIMLRLFGIPYITAPMEAEAQCAELVTLGLVDGIITDDSDVFLFGGLRVLKNMFNQSKTVECFLLSDLERELGLDRDKLIRLAYLLGSDYTDGLPGVGPVVAMELLKEFPGEDGLHKFKDWWRKVQSGKDIAEDTGTAFRKRFKKRFKELFIPDDWPNPAVRDAYYHPTVDESEEPFKWGLPDLDALRDFFNSELGWSQPKVDDLLLPIIHKMGKRGQSTTNKQGNLAGFFDVPVGGAAPRKRQAYASKRLQQVVSDFRKERAKAQSAESSDAASNSGERQSQSDDEYSEAPAKKRKTSKTNGARAGGKERAAPRSKVGRGGKSMRGGKGKRTARKHKASSESEEDVPLADVRTQSSSPPPLAVNLRPRPKPAYKGAQPPTPASDDEDSA